MDEGKPLGSGQVKEDLIQTVENHAPYDTSEGDHREKILAFLRTAPNPFDRANFDPGHVVGSACIVAEESGQIVLVAHSRLRRWLQPGGHIEHGEPGPLVAAMRESREEVGVELDSSRAQLLDLDIHRIPASRDPSHLHFDFRFLCPIEWQPLRAMSDAVDARWFTAAEARGLDLDEGLKRTFAKLIQRGLLRA